MVSIASSRLRPVEDPLTAMLAALHKVMWVEQLPPGLARDPRRRCVEAFRRLLFAPGTTPASLKSHLVKLMGAEGDLVRDASGRPVDFGALGGDGGDGAPGCGLSYDKLHQVGAQEGWNPCLIAACQYWLASNLIIPFPCLADCGESSFRERLLLQCTSHQRARLARAAAPAKLWPHNNTLT